MKLCGLGDWTLGAKLAAAVLVLSIVPVAAVTIANIHDARDHAWQSATELLDARADHLVDQLDRFNDNYARAATRLANVAEVISLFEHPPESLDSLTARLWNHRNNDPLVRGVMLIDRSGVVRVATEPNLGNAKTDFVVHALAGEHEISEPYKSDAGVMTVAYASPVRNVQGEVVGVVTFCVRADALVQLTGRSNGLAGAGSFASIYDHDGHEIAQSKAKRTELATATELTRVSREGMGRDVFLERVDEGSYYGVARRFSSTDWTVFYLVPEATITDPLVQLTRGRVALAALIGIGAILGGMLIARRIAGPIRRVDAATARFAAGQLGTRVDVHGDNEVGRLGEAFNQMAERIEEQTSELLQHRDQLEQQVAARTNELADRERRYRELYEASPDMQLTAEIPSTIIIDVNQTLCGRLGYTREELIGQPYSVIYDEEYAPTVDQRMRKFQGGMQIEDAERRLVCKDGTRIEASLTLRAIRDEKGEMTGAYAALRDIGMRKQLERENLELLSANRQRDVAEAVQRSEEKFRALIDGVQDYAIIMLDAAGRIATWNDGATKVKGFTREEVVGREMKSLLAAEMGEDHVLAMLAHAAEHGQFEDHGWRTRRDGSRFWANTHVTSVRDREGTLEGYAWITRDFSERRRADDQLQLKQTELERSLKERELLLQEVHHRVKNNLQVISSLINMQTRKLPVGATRDALAECQTRVLAISLIHEKLYQSNDYAHVPFAEYAKSLANNVVLATGVRPIRLELDIDDVGLEIDNAIPCGLLLNELITNSVKHAFPDGRDGTVRVSLKADRDHLRLVVSDTGVGFGASGPTREKSMGMRLVTTLAAQLGGKLESDGSNGARFEVRFPRIAVRKAA